VLILLIFDLVNDDKVSLWLEGFMVFDDYLMFVDVF